MKNTSLHLFFKFIQEEEDGTMYLGDVNQVHEAWLEEDWQRYYSKAPKGKEQPTSASRPARVGGDQPMTLYGFMEAMVNMHLITNLTVVSDFTNASQDEIDMLNCIDHIVVERGGGNMRAAALNGSAGDNGDGNELISPESLCQAEVGLTVNPALGDIVKNMEIVNAVVLDNYSGEAEAIFAEMNVDANVNIKNHPLFDRLVKLCNRLGGIIRVCCDIMER